MYRSLTRNIPLDSKHSNYACLVDVKQWMSIDVTML